MAERPLADRCRPTNFDEIVGQKHLFGPNGSIRKMCSRGYVPNMIFYGPPGTGKTTSASIISSMSQLPIHKLNATSASLADIKSVISEASSFMGMNGVLLYLDEIQYFNKKQQQSLLEYIENGRITLIASTTENPYLYVHPAIISRSAVFEFKAVSAEDIADALKRALSILNSSSDAPKTMSDESAHHIAELAAGDVRRALNLLENVYYTSGDEIDGKAAESFSPSALGNFDKSGTVHYDMLSALQKSIRGSDPDAAVFYLAKILEGGDLLGACRRLQVIACEDIGLAYPMAVPFTRSCVEMARDLGMPEARIPLVDAAVLLATAPKSNSAYLAMAKAGEDISAGRGQTVPPYMRPSERYSGYKYPHDYPDHYVDQQYLPDDLKTRKYYEFGDNKNERAAMEYWNKIKKK